MPLQRTDVVDAAMRLLDDTGLDGLSTRRLATELGVRPGALYWHVASKQDLLDALAERVLGEVPEQAGPAGAHWTERTAALARAMRAAMLAHRDGARLLAGASALGPNRLGFAERLMEVLGHSGAPLAATAAAGDAVMSYVTGFVLQEQSSPQIGPEGFDPDGGDGPRGAAAAPFDAGRFPHLAARLTQWSPDTPRQTFAAGLEILVEGLTVYLGKAAAA
ncbi:TetR/AcrR family transcriptional regulator C-terminal domain-containing protein [Kitasatospora sp. NA04385]|uniref:TetR/AcrR family transcriptional regulator C-terminal domain-containing protein n=1 Tax=Kitasatospora sp. NA04385 TaxID=2742135 RepID=UPI00159136B9|nr:TetR/AcrR family transcriptional regulator C-terminal domain-containing protein [Kitasatospora sp. NA04385]QKW21675.1 TetR/AcrR family transcriptional regulator C-terminal domain-containing protein [Kitasatospora sp. NA04385]